MIELTMVSEGMRLDKCSKRSGEERRDLCRAVRRGPLLISDSDRVTNARNTPVTPLECAQVCECCAARASRYALQSAAITEPQPEHEAQLHLGNGPFSLSVQSMQICMHSLRLRSLCSRPRICLSEDLCCRPMARVCTYQRGTAARCQIAQSSSGRILLRPASG